jgi:hypothetical protein
MKKNLLVLLVVSICACNPENEPQGDCYSFKTSWLTGEWSLKLGVQLSEYMGDTVFVAKDSTKFTYSVGGGKQESLFKVKLHFDKNGGYKYEETNDNGTGSIESRWKWLNTSQNATHLFFPIAFNSYFGDAVSLPYQVITLSETQLVIEDIRGYFHFEYTRTSPIDNQGVFEPIKLIQPQQILGNWKLEDYSETFSDGRRRWLENDTLFYETYDYYQVLQTVKEKYELTIAIGENGSFTSTENRDGQLNTQYDYWYWSDETEPHKMIYLFPVINGTIADFKVKTLSEDTLVVEYEKITYTFKKQPASPR